MIHRSSVRTFVDYSLAVVAIVLVPLYMVLVGPSLVAGWRIQDFLLAALFIGLFRYQHRVEKLEARVARLQAVLDQHQSPAGDRQAD